MSGAPPAAAAPAPSKSSSGRTIGAVIGVLVIVVIVVVAGLYVAKIGPFAASKGSGGAPSEAGGFTGGQVVTFLYNGTYLCTPALTTFYPGEGSISSTTNCEVGGASQTAVQQVPEWVLVPAFAGLTIFGATAFGASSRGFPMFGGQALLTDCGGGGSPTACPDHPTAIYSPAFTTVEQFLNISSGADGYPEGVLPTPAHDHLLNTTATFPNVEWGTIVVLVFDPNIWPDRATGACTALVASNLSSPTANCLTSITGLVHALSTSSSAVAAANGGSNNNGIWKALGGPKTQVVVPGDVTVAEINNLNANLYMPFAVQPGAPSSFPS